jgi:hypothetical protein
MRIYGLDFTSAPRQAKPITCAECWLEGEVLAVERVVPLVSFAAFEAFLRSPGPWVAGFDFPFGQPRRLVEALGWPQPWEAYVRRLSGEGKPAFEAALTAYCAGRPLGDKHHLRATDVPARPCSPMMLHRVPVAKMFFEGASRLLASGVSILPCRPTRDPRIALEAYPALVARRWLGLRSYKSDERARQTPERAAARRDLLRALRSEKLPAAYGLSLALEDGLTDSLVEDATGDRLDALLCAVQAAWAYTQRARDHGIPPGCDPLEGCIVDPVIRDGPATGNEDGAFLR